MGGEKRADRVQTQGDVEPCLEHDGGSLRCLCGSLLARYVPGGIELKCRRCKRAVVVPIPPAPDGERRRSLEHG
jgi:hypothetical protein